MWLGTETTHMNSGFHLIRALAVFSPQDFTVAVLMFGVGRGVQIKHIWHTDLCSQVWVFYSQFLNLMIENFDKKLSSYSYICKLAANPFSPCLIKTCKSNPSTFTTMYSTSTHTDTRVISLLSLKPCPTQTSVNQLHIQTPDRPCTQYDYKCPTSPTPRHTHTHTYKSHMWTLPTPEPHISPTYTPEFSMLLYYGNPPFFKTPRVTLIHNDRTSPCKMLMSCFRFELSCCSCCTLD